MKSLLRFILPVVAFVFTLALGIFLFWYGGQDLTARSPDHAWGLATIILFAFIAIIGMHLCVEEWLK